MTQFRLPVVIIALSAVIAAQDGPVGTIRQPLVAGAVVSKASLEDFGLLTLRIGGGICSASLLRNSWVITAAHCVEVNGASSKQIPDPARPGQNLVSPIDLIQVAANWETVQEKRAIRIETFRPYDVALIQTSSPFLVHKSATGFSRLIFQDGQFPYFGEAVGTSILAFGRGINVLASGSGATATPSQSDGQYRAAYFRPTREDDRAYWYPGGAAQTVAGGDSGGPSFAWVLSGYALVGVHTNTLVNFIPGKPTGGWTWVSSVSEAADTPLMPLLPQLAAIMGPVPPGPTEPALEPPPPGFIGTFSKTPPDLQPIWLYGIRPNGDLLWYRKDTNSSSWQGPKTVGKGWTGLKDVIAAGGNRLYGLTQNGKLMWYQHLGFNDGSFTWKPIAEVGSGWTYSRIFSGGDGIIYAIRRDGKLFWYRNTGFRDGTRDWLGPKEVGSSWNGLRDVFSEGKGDVYAVKPDGTLVLYQQKDYENGSDQWAPPRTVGSGWNSFQQIIPAGNGVILAIQPDGKLLWYKRQIVVPKLGRAKDVWQGPIPIGSGWNDFGKVVALLPETSSPLVR